MGDVRTSDEQHRANRRQQNGQGQAHAPCVLLPQRDDADTRQIFVRDRVSLLKGARDHRHVRLGLA